MNTAGGVTLEKVSLSYKTPHQRVDIFRDFSFSVSPGKFVSIMGPSGRGKSSLLNLIAGFIPPDEGDVIVSGHRVNHLTDKQLNAYRNQEIGYVFQFFNLISKFNVEDNVAVPLLISGKSAAEIKTRTHKILDIVGMTERMKHYPEQLSGGEQQRVAIARALINEPKILLADEPTGNLDRKNSEHILQLFRQINQDTGITMILVSHDDLVKDVSDDVLNIEELSGVV